ncbi:hypothetical protein [Streptomyces phaeochromogenes]|uniref:hypothetical protein n=1 Tax=Streptomyces phaeochromogenes TaxID=1923 RepID=UPI002E13AA86|nr:hypothetical protein OG437_36790 [Streptomyces phaeochromogenes]
MRGRVPWALLRVRLRRRWTPHQSPRRRLTCDADGRTDTMAADANTNRYAYGADDNLTRTTLPNTPVEDRAYDPPVG